MTCYHCAIKVLSRAAGRSSVQMSAYIAGNKLHDDRLGVFFDHTTKEEVCYNAMIFDDRVPEELRTQSAFFNAAEAAEKSDRAQVARSWEIALPHELSLADSITLAHTYARSLVEIDKMPGVQVSVHNKEGNLHAHILAPMRDMDERGNWETKQAKAYAVERVDERGRVERAAMTAAQIRNNPEWHKIPLLDPDKVRAWEDSHGMRFDRHSLPDDEVAKCQQTRERKGKGIERMWQRETIERHGWDSRDLLLEWRERAATYQNRALATRGIDARVSHLSLKEQGVDRLPTIHEGAAARELEDCGGISDRCQHNRDVRQINTSRNIMERIAEQVAQLRRLQEDLQIFLRQLKEQGIRETMRQRREEQIRRAQQSADVSKSDVSKMDVTKISLADRFAQAAKEAAENNANRVARPDREREL